MRDGTVAFHGRSLTNIETHHYANVKESRVLTLKIAIAQRRRTLLKNSLSTLLTLEVTLLIS
jgi:hypothetical protein